MDKIGFFGFIDSPDAPDRLGLPDRVDPFSGKVENDMAETGFFQFFCMFTFRRKENDFPALILKEPGVFEPEVVKIPVSVCK